MLKTSKGIVLRERTSGENDKFIDFLSQDYGLMEVKVRGAKKAGSKSNAATQLFSYTKLCITKNRTPYYVLNSAEPCDTNYGIRLNVEKLALASYFSELIRYTVLPEQPCEPVEKLLGRALFFLGRNTRPNELIRCVFELRLACEIGLLPALAACSECCCFESDCTYFDYQKGNLLCLDCAKELGIHYEPRIMARLNKTLLHAVRFIALSEPEKIFNFRTSDHCQKQLSVITEQYLITQLGRTFPTLEYYKNLVRSSP